MEQELGRTIQAMGDRLFWMVSGAVALAVIVGLIGLWWEERQHSARAHRIWKEW